MPLPKRRKHDLDNDKMEEELFGSDPRDEKKDAESEDVDEDSAVGDLFDDLSPVVSGDEAPEVQRAEAQRQERRAHKRDKHQHKKQKHSKKKSSDCEPLNLEPTLKKARGGSKPKQRMVEEADAEEEEAVVGDEESDDAEHEVDNDVKRGGNATGAGLIVLSSAWYKLIVNSSGCRAISL